MPEKSVSGRMDETTEPAELTFGKEAAEPTKCQPWKTLKVESRRCSSISHRYRVGKRDECGGERGTETSRRHQYTNEKLQSFHTMESLEQNTRKCQLYGRRTRRNSGNTGFRLGTLRTDSSAQKPEGRWKNDSRSRRGSCLGA